jgi:hypothetical protein
MAGVVLDNEVCPVAYDDQPATGSVVLELSARQLDARLKLASAPLLDALDARSLPFRKTPSSHAAWSRQDQRSNS